LGLGASRSNDITLKKPEFKPKWALVTVETVKAGFEGYREVFPILLGQFKETSHLSVRNSHIRGSYPSYWVDNVMVLWGLILRDQQTHSINAVSLIVTELTLEHF
jgi:hypothetical protein